MAHLIEIRDRKVVDNDQLDDPYLPIGTSLDRPDGHYVAVGMAVEGPYDRQAAMERIDHLQRATRVELENEDRKKQSP